MHHFYIVLRKRFSLLFLIELSLQTELKKDVPTKSKNKAASEFLIQDDENVNIFFDEEDLILEETSANIDFQQNEKEGIHK
ncbi:10440_t:CDS:2 [Cetraspora pellucida]|uniref:10440_t:CDS:1 n=1 Tax=Cetraspora pellucida TaxID=1433469 RepID=A0ACA9MXT0_9GLOM|nr:10440_t:CDS:2 [Cetraspora pellucida]